MSPVKNLRIAPEVDLQPITDFVDNFVLPRSQVFDEAAEFDPEMPHHLYRLGFLRSLVPKKNGGTEWPLTDLIWVGRKIGYGSSGVGATFIGNILGFSAVASFAEGSLKDRLFERVLNHYTLWSFAMTERHCGSDLEKIKTQARRTSDGYILSGEKNYITNATYSTDLVVFAQEKDENGVSKGISCFYVPGDSPNLERGAGEKKLGWRESNTGHLRFKDIHLPIENRLGEAGTGIQILTHCLSRSKTLVGSVGVGICDRALDLTFDRLQSTDRYDRPLLDRPTLRHALTRLMMKTEAAWLLVCKAAGTWDSGSPCIQESSLAKLAAGEIATEVTSRCVEFSGVHGYLMENEIQRLYRDAKAVEIVEGSNFIQEVIASKFMPKAARKMEKETMKKTG